MSAAPPGRVGIGVVGCGTLARAVHLRLLRRSSLAHVVALADPDRGALAAARRLAPGAAALENARELLEIPQVEAVVVCSSTLSHAAVATAVLEAGRHLYLEKPIAIEVADAERVLEAAAGSSGVAAIGFNRRFHPLVRRAAEVIRSGAIGAVRGGASWFCEPVEDTASWRLGRHEEGGGPMLDLASHHVDLLRWLLEDEPEWVSAAETGGSCSLQIGFREGAVAACLCSFEGPRADALVLLGEAGTLELDRYARRLRLARPARRSPSVRDERPRTSPEMLEWRARSLVRPAHDPSYAGALRAWLAAVSGASVELPSLRDGLRSLQTLAAARRSLETGARAAI